MSRSRFVGLLAPFLIACTEESSLIGLPGINPGIPTRPSLPQAFTPTGLAASGAVAVQLFDWAWTDVASECELRLGPMGFQAALLSPPQEHIVGGTWWTRYQPVSYSIDQSRSGTGAQFDDMLGRCAAVGVDIYIDAVINHMTATSGTGTNGTVFTKYEYPGLYAASDFHTPCGITDWNSARQVQDCELVGLADLRTGSRSVQQKIADYLIGLSRRGVAGFRIDAAKHIQPVELDSIITLVNRTLVAEGLPRPYLFLEVIDYGGEGVTRNDYYGVGFASGGGSDISEFKATGINNKFLGVGGQRVSELATFSEGNWGLMPSAKGMIFIQNHDTQRSGGLLWSDGDMARLANVFLLAQPYGFPMVMSGFTFDRASQAGRDAGPPVGGNGAPAGQACAADPATAAVGVWACEHRDPWLRQMMRFRRTVTGSAQALTWNDGQQAVAFSRGSLGFVAINNASSSVTATVPTSLPPGLYCDLLSGGRVGTSCAGSTYTVEADGSVALTLAARSAVALLVGDSP